MIQSCGPRTLFIYRSCFRALLPIFWLWCFFMHPILWDVLTTQLRCPLKMTWLAAGGLSISVHPDPLELKVSYHQSTYESQIHRKEYDCKGAKAYIYIKTNQQWKFRCIVMIENQRLNHLIGRGLWVFRKAASVLCELKSSDHRTYSVDLHFHKARRLQQLSKRAMVSNRDLLIRLSV